MLKPGIMDSIRVWIKVLPYTPQNLLGIRLLLNGSFLDDRDMFFQSNTKQKPLNSNYDDIFGGFQKSTNQSSPSIYNKGVSTFDYDSIFSKSGGRSSSMNLYDDDVFGGMPGLKRPPPKPGQVSRPEKVKSSAASSVDDLEEFAMGGSVHDKASRYMEAEDAPKKSQLKGEDDRESILGASYRSNRVPKSRATTLDPLFDAKIQNKEQKTSTTVSSSAKKVSPAPMKIMVDDLSSIFRAASVYGEFEEVKGESEETRRATLGRYQRTQDRVTSWLGYII
ncbi:hypothetical protein SLEP1_g2093 [Rubroshorea leprosula]|uniref:DUF4283 domain-containing protein n=1 Tax=Rubroshorea leprosula TaxID=152421 RepID=A0AAV5HQ53_9ROSI|nr:hypothetical protein SLEP1_g2093 [Rubroshorea leprosula]